MKATVDGATIRNLRLVAEHGVATVWSWDRDLGRAVVLASQPGGAVRAGATQNWVVGDLLLEPQRGCGCKHPMYLFVPPVSAR